MVKVAFLVKLEAKPGKETAVEDFLKGGLPIVQEEPATTTWYALKLGPSSYGITAAAPKAIPTIPALPRNAANNPSPAWTRDGDDAGHVASKGPR